jgi:hypothetical protein
VRAHLTTITFVDRVDLLAIDDSRSHDLEIVGWHRRFSSSDLEGP